jgi:type I restriction enzyme S subunit
MREGWIKTNIGSAFHIQQGKTLAISKLMGGKYPVYGANGIVGYFDEFNFDFPVTGLGCRGSCGTIYYIDRKAFLANNVMAIWEKDASKIDSRYIPLALGNVDLIASGAISGQVQPQITKQGLEPVAITIPPLPEQKRIVDLISSVDSYKGALEQQLESAKKSRNAVLHELLTAGGDDWVEHKLVDMFEIYQPQTIAKSLMSDDGEFIVFGANGPIGRYHEFNHEEPEVVVTCRGATCGTINMTPPKTWITGNAMVVSPKTSGVSKDFLYWELVAGVDIQSVISGSAQPQITREGLAPVKIKIPPLSRQEEIVDLITGFELTIRELEESLRKTKTLRSGLLSDLLSGEHEIPASYDKVMGAA